MLPIRRSVSPLSALSTFEAAAHLCGALHTCLAGVQVDDSQLAVDAFAEVGPGNHFFGCSYTIANYQTAFCDNETADNEPFEQWEANGTVDAATRANRIWKRRYAEYEAPPLDMSMEEALRDFVARRKASMNDIWY